MKTCFRVDDHSVECTSEPLEGTYFRVSWNLRLMGSPLTDEPLQAESYVCRAITEAEAQDVVQARARLMSGLHLMKAVGIEQSNPNAAAGANLNMLPDAPVVSGR
ncbi:hypothetical protein [Ralstonia pickettii]|uniref:hypothetical protein n=1 Tax=Ralstonia pickettii TaxID=329 RepID=UPI0015BB1DAA|nr:hypothetical protein [Ralstonia pickettii]NWK44877.1 hypothetical protein [Ralstonia pickettii]